MKNHEIIEQANLRGGAYHKIEFPDGTVLNGRVDMKKYIQKYCIPDDLSGKTVLDVGCSTGFFSFEFAKRGAKKVVGIHIDDEIDYDVQEISNELMGTKVEFVRQDLLTLDENFAKFDLVFCSNMLQHVSDPIAAIRKLRLVSKNLVIICTTIVDDDRYNDLPVLLFHGGEGKSSQGKTYYNYYSPTVNAFEKMMLFAKFKKVQQVSTFKLVNESQISLGLDCVIHGYV